MASTWNGQALQTYFLRKYGFRDTASGLRVLGWINDIQREIAASHDWPFLKMKLKKQVTSGQQEINIAPDVPSAPVIALASGGSITDASVIKVKCTFLIFDESGREINSVESEPSDASNSVTTANPSKTIDVSSIPLYTGTSTIKPTQIYRRIYMKVGSNPYYLAATITNNTDTTVSITTDPTVTYEPPEYSMVYNLTAEDPIIEGSGVSLAENSLDQILKYDPNLTSSGTPQYYARVGNNKVLLYPKPSSSYTISFWVKKVPSRIFNDEDRPIQIDHSLKEVLEAGVTWKIYEDKDQDGQESKKNNYVLLRDSSKGIFNKTGGQVLTVKRVC